jgi:hypothetical protein
MPSTSERQRRFMGAELGRLRSGEGTETGMSERQLRDYARKGGRSMKNGKRYGKRSKKRG